MIAIPSLVIVGGVLLLLGFLMMYWASSRNLKDIAIWAVIGAAWTLLWKRQRPGVPEEITSRVDKVRTEGTHIGKAKVVAGYAVKHVVALVASMTGLVLFALGALLAAIGVFWR
jgi:hypothetical protein